ncbi:hypothetical protein KTO58_14525 [Chitinophaga pendula]|uniref:hypothetical protein n=1 Tax=Chitinophaga TaxID=79328 RepID=UPI000BAED96D|nr:MULTISPECIES: hypothetical protein [Chitinophaga]ASZ12051.1 hypothetical protein CK934_14310 [Chitinophaga sp. MD30]UCJ04916.1 hypothetical protein KTO58_14525 [Chitinophaga pendula]
MKQLYAYLLLLTIIFFTACSKNKIDPDNLRNGQEVELRLDHYTTGIRAGVYLNMPGRENIPQSYIENFEEREAGYTYVVKAKVVRPSQPLMDGPGYWFVYLRTVRKDKYTDPATFQLPLLEMGLMDAIFSLRKEGDKFYYGKYLLAPADAAVATGLQTAFDKRPSPADPTHWKDLLNARLRVVHDPANFGKGYKVLAVIF